MLDLQKLWKPQIVYNIDGALWEFEISPVPTGMWNSIWNVIRRTALAYYPSIAITAIKIDWIDHEYTTMEWVSESVIQIMLNLKDLRFDWSIEEESRQIWLEKKFKWIGKYYAKDLDIPWDIKLLNDDTYLFEITDDNIELNFKFRLEKWYWYYSLDFLKKRAKEKDEIEIGILDIDNSFKIIKYITYEVDEILTDFIWWSKDKIKIKMETISDKISPKDVISFIAEVLTSYLKLFIYEDCYIDRSMLVEYDDIADWWDNGEQKLQEVKKTPIDVLPLSERTRNALIKNNIMFVEELEKKTKSELVSLKWVWKKAIEEVEKALTTLWKRLGS